MAPVNQEIVPHQKAQTAADHQGHKDNVWQRLSGDGSQRRPRAQKIKPGVAERRDRVEQRHPEPPSQTVPGAEPQRQQRRPRPLAGKGHTDGPAGQPHNAPHLKGPYAVHQNGPLAQADAAVKQDGHQDGDGHKPHASHLDQQQNHRLSEEGELGPGVVQHQPRDAGGGRRGKERVQKRQGVSIPGGERQSQQHAAQQNQRGKSQGQRLNRIQLDPAANHRAHPLRTIMPSLYTFS